MALFPWFLWLHVSGNLVWIGSTMSVGLLLGRSRAPEAARWLYLRVVNPSQLVAIVFGLGMLLMDFGHYMHAHWMHGKLFVALIAIGLTHVLGARARRAAEGAQNSPSSRQPDAVGANLTLAFLVCAVLAVAFVTVLRSMMT
jgi:putative membrane protein